MQILHISVFAPIELCKRRNIKKREIENNANHVTSSKLQREGNIECLNPSLPTSMRRSCG